MKRFLTLALLGALATTSGLWCMDENNNNKKKLKLSRDESEESEQSQENGLEQFHKSINDIHSTPADKFFVYNSENTEYLDVNHELKKRIKTIPFSTLAAYQKNEDTGDIVLHLSQLKELSILDQEASNSDKQGDKLKKATKSLVGQVVSKGVPLAVGFGICYLAMKSGWISGGGD